VGGSHISAALLIQNIDRQRFEPIVILHKDGPLRHFLTKESINHRFLNIPCFAGTTPKIVDIAASIARTTPTLYGFLRDNKIDIVHSNDLRMNLTWPFPTRLATARFVWHQRLVVSGSPLWKILCSASNHIVSISHTVRETLPASGHGRATIVPDPFAKYQSLPHEEAKAQLLHNLGIAPPASVIGFVGNMTHQKRPLMFVKAAHLLAQNQSKIIFVMVGDDRGGKLSDAQLLAKRLRIERNVFCIGHKYPIEPWLSAFDVLLAPAVLEGYGRAVIEALLCGTPVVASNSGGHQEIVTNNDRGYLAAPDDADAFATATQVLLNRESRVPEEERALLEQQHSSENHVKCIEAIYDTLIQR
tara:strand:- start:436 stop:1512 length:1077 start_codon:yes stop_codon:yes gene_type:complete